MSDLEKIRRVQENFFSVQLGRPEIIQLFFRFYIFQFNIFARLDSHLIGFKCMVRSHCDDCENVSIFIIIDT